MPANRGRGADRKKEKRDSGEIEQINAQATEFENSERWERDPKKQYVRINGWVRKINDYIESRQAVGENMPLKILTLPGRYAMDIGLFRREGIVIQTDSGNLNVAICDEGKGTEIANQLAKYGGVLAFSDRLLNKELRENGNAIPKHFPFDVINLDFCNTLIPADQENLDSLQWIFEYQRGKGFLLLLTAREYPNPQRYLNLINQNLENEEDFAQRYEEIFGSRDSNLCTENLTQFSQIIYPKLVCSFAKKYRYKVVEHFVAHYSRETASGGMYHMVSHSFELEPIGRMGRNKFRPRLDHIGQDRIEEALGQPKFRRQMQKSSEEYSQFIPSLLLQDRSDFIDEILQNDNALNQEFQEQGNDLIYWLNTDD